MRPISRWFVPDRSTSAQWRILGLPTSATRRQDSIEVTAHGPGTAGNLPPQTALPGTFEFSHNLGLPKLVDESPIGDKSLANGVANTYVFKHNAVYPQKTDFSAPHINSYSRRDHNKPGLSEPPGSPHPTAHDIFRIVKDQGRGRTFSSARPRKRKSSRPTIATRGYACRICSSRRSRRWSSVACAFVSFFSSH